jgi:hypothetical protein
MTKISCDKKIEICCTHAGKIQVCDFIYSIENFEMIFSKKQEIKLGNYKMTQRIMRTD